MTVDFEALRTRMLVKYPFFGSIIANVKFKEANVTSHGMPTAATNGKTVFVNPKVTELYDEDELFFMLCHEICHIAFDHILRSEGKIMRIWNKATDAVINQFLKRDDLKLIDGVIDIPEAVNYDAETLYEKMLAEEKMRQNNNNQRDNEMQQPGEGGIQGDSSDEDSNEQNEGHDSHDMWDEAVRRHKEGKDVDDEDDEKKGGSGQDDSDKNEDGKEDVGNDQEDSDKEKDGSGGNMKDDDDKESLSEEERQMKDKQKELSDMGEKNGFSKNIEEKKKQLEKFKNDLTRQASGAGKTSRGSLRDIGVVGHSKPIVDWRYYLKEATKYELDWSYKNAYIEDGVVTPQLEKYFVSDTEIVLDTSGSIDSELLKNFLRECKNILLYSRMKVGCFDTEFYGFHEIKTEADIEKMTFEGGGGTDFNAAVEAFTFRTENKIIFTDGYASMPRKAVNAIWVVFGDYTINPPGGKVIYISKEDYKKLCQPTSKKSGRTR